MLRNNDISANLDWISILLFMVLLMVGWINIYAAIYDETASQHIWSLDINSGKQLIYIAAGAVIIMIIVAIDARFYETFAYLFYGIILVVLMLVPVIGKEVGGNKAWISVGQFSVQPSEFAKFITALAVAKYIGSVGFRMDNLRNQAILFILIMVPIGLIQLQKDTGTALVFTSFILVFYREGMSPFLIIVGLCSAALFILTLLIAPLYLQITVVAIWLLLVLLGAKKLLRIVVLTSGAVIICVVIQSVDYIVNNVLKPHQRDRIKVLIDPNSDPMNTGWNVTQSKIAIGSGGFLGKGFLEGTQTKFDFVPKQSTDFIFCTIGEEHGWIGSLFTIALFVALMLRITFLAERQKSRFARSYGYCVASIFFFHFAINIAMTVGLFPVVGIPLPFFSYGGSSLWGFTILLFVFLKLDASRTEVLQRI